MSTLERHCQLLLRAYPAAYREVRGEEMIGTLLEATPPSRSWPLPRDIRCLIFGGLRARAAHSRQLTTAANLRIALLAGVAAYLAYFAASFVSWDLMAAFSTYGHTQPAPFDWPNLLASALTLLAVALALLTGRRAVILAAALPAAAVVCYVGPWDPANVGFTAAHLVFLAALVALAGGTRQSRRWLMLVGLLALLPLAAGIGPQYGPVLYGALFTAAGISVVWAVIDARPAIAMVLFFLALWLPMAVTNLIQGFTAAIALTALVIVTVVAVPALWLLRRQSAHQGRPTQT